METPKGKIDYSLTVSEFKQRHNLNEIQVLQVPGSVNEEGKQKRFWKSGKAGGKVAYVIDLEAPLQMLVMEDGVEILCNQGIGAETLAIV